MDVNATVDVGKNIKDLLEKLAHQLGTTVDKIYPYYVKKAVVDAYSMLGIMGLMWLGTAVFTVVTYYAWKRHTRLQKEDKLRYGDIDKVMNTAIFCTVVTIITAIIAGMTTVVNLTDVMQGILNPDYVAIHNLLRDVRN